VYLINSRRLQLANDNTECGVEEAAGHIYDSFAVLVVVILLLLRFEYRSETSFISFLFLLCVFVLLIGYSIVAEAICYWYLLILIYFLYLKYMTALRAMTRPAPSDRLQLDRPR
jgi:hypothetical protein